MKISRDDIRNVAIIAHVDHGKTTLVDELLKQSGVFRENQEVAERVMDSNDIERERGITILSKNTAVHYKGTKINIIDTPGHADFGGEVERVLKMVNGVILVVDAFEGAMPQTKFVLKKALELDLHVIVCVNKIDRPEARIEEVEEEVLELLLDLEATDEQLDCPFIYASAKDGVAKKNLDDDAVDMAPLFETIIDYIPAPTGDPEADTQVLISTIDYNEYVGRIAIGRIERGTMKVNQDVTIGDYHNTKQEYRGKIVTMYQIEGLNRVPVNEAKAGNNGAAKYYNLNGVEAFGLSLGKIDKTFYETNSDFNFNNSLGTAKNAKGDETMSGYDTQTSFGEFTLSRQSTEMGNRLYFRLHRGSNAFFGVTIKSFELHFSIDKFTVALNANPTSEKSLVEAPFKINKPELGEIKPHSKNGKTYYSYSYENVADMIAYNSLYQKDAVQAGMATNEATKKTISCLVNGGKKWFGLGNNTYFVESPTTIKSNGKDMPVGYRITGAKLTCSWGSNSERGYVITYNNGDEFYYLGIGGG